MTPAQRFFPAILRLVATAYEVSIDDMTAEDQWAREDIREARRVAYVVASDVVGMTHRQIALLMQRDHKAIHAGISKLRRDMKDNPLLRKVVSDVAARVRGAVQDFRLFGAEAAEWLCLRNSTGEISESYSKRYRVGRGGAEGASRVHRRNGARNGRGSLSGDAGAD